ncbi:LysR family transcriptional regulator [Mesorhizobium sp. B2-7-3]|uniref:LysR substrate-binding domain-containing protein n=1 Tax=Mesorhizobium sp. B2-7-3 TaxID=2589907 RepID=UPI00112B2523|nr:LysR substrate-binding domain-containing protein [Mesorhizobium sp. B2-7-3]TPJ18873.1 LysR family transcriptional regulator [Mesorhizobium sp. B2-7-3]
MLNLPMELLRSFVAIVESGWMGRATERIFVTQSALSLQVKRLEETLQTLLFYREGRRLRLTPAGEELLGYARSILTTNDQAVIALTGESLAGALRVGLVQDFAEALLGEILLRFVKANPNTQLQVRVGGTMELMDLLASDRLDLALGIGAQDDPAAICSAPTVWLGCKDLLKLKEVPLALMQSPCRFRDMAIAPLEAAGRPYRIFLETASLSALRVAVESDLAITLRTEIFASGLIDVLATDLPRLNPVSYILKTRDDSHPVVARFAEIIRMGISDPVGEALSPSDH